MCYTVHLLYFCNYTVVRDTYNKAQPSFALALAVAGCFLLDALFLAVFFCHSSVNISHDKNTSNVKEVLSGYCSISINATVLHTADWCSIPSLSPWARVLTLPSPFNNTFDI